MATITCSVSNGFDFPSQAASFEVFLARCQRSLDCTDDEEFLVSAFLDGGYDREVDYTYRAMADICAMYPGLIFVMEAAQDGELIEVGYFRDSMCKVVKPVTVDGEVFVPPFEDTP
jgi:hypothetical protein